MAASTKRAIEGSETAGPTAGRRRTKSAPPRPAAERAALGERTATVHEAKTHLSRLLAEVEAGGTVVITRRGEPVAKLESVKRRGPRVPGRLQGIIEFDESFFDPLPEDMLKALEGE